MLVSSPRRLALLSCILGLCWAAGAPAATAPDKPPVQASDKRPAASAPAAPATAAADPWLWLEDLNADKSLDWVKQQNARSVHELADTPEFKAMNDRFLEIVNSRARIPTVTKIGDLYYNFW